MSAAVFIHVGLPKAGSTYLQEHVFNRFDAVRYFPPEHEFSYALGCRANSERLPVDEAERARILERWAECVKGSEVPIAISNESFSMGDWQIGARWHDDPDIINSRLKKYLPGCKIALVLRPQHSWVVSWWKHHIRGRCGLTIDELLQHQIWTDHISNRLYYARLVKEYRDQFGAENLVVHFHRDVASSTETVIESYCGILGQEPPPVSHGRSNTSRSDLMAILRMRSFKLYHGVSRALIPGRACERVDRAYQLLWKRYIERSDRFLSRIVKTDGLLQDARRRIADQFHDDNLELQRLLDIDLTGKGFWLHPANERRVPGDAGKTADTREP